MQGTWAAGIRPAGWLAPRFLPNRLRAPGTPEHPSRLPQRPREWEAVGPWWHTANTMGALSDSTMAGRGCSGILRHLASLSCSEFQRWPFCRGAYRQGSPTAGSPPHLVTMGWSKDADCFANAAGRPSTRITTGYNVT